ncbi:MAG: nitric oxide reductase activation protein [Betaproteobacteria bacterium]|nr:nitric oxide reductase activation protein [Betaproteobacteria bacterium]
MSDFTIMESAETLRRIDKLPLSLRGAQVRTVLLPTHPRSSLHAFLHGMLSRRVEVVRRTAEAEEMLRPVLEDNRLALPMDSWLKSKQNSLCRAAAAHALAHWRYSPAAQAIDGLKPIGRRVADAIEDARAEALLLDDYPGLRSLWKPFHEADESSGVSLDALLARLAHALLDAEYHDGNFWVDKARRLFDAQRDHLSDYSGFRHLASILANDLGQMRVRFEPDSGRYLRYRDDNTWLWAPDTETVVIATNESNEKMDDNPSDSAASGAASEVPTERDDAAQATALYTYSEWDYRLGREHPHWATVLERAPTLGELDAALRANVAADRLVRLPHCRTRRTTHPSIIRRRYLQSEGDTLDIDATIMLRVALRQGSLPELNVFSAIRPSPPETSVLILLDLSASTNEYAAALEKRATCQLAERLNDGYHRVAVHGFCSDGRHRVFYHRFKDFDTPFDEACRNRLLCAHSGLSTRIGVALRHAVAQMRAELPRRVKILMVGDGEPADIDVFDPRYLPADVAHVIYTTRRRGIDILALSFASGATASEVADNATNKGDEDIRQSQLVYNANTFTAAMARAHAFIAQ